MYKRNIIKNRFTVQSIRSVRKYTQIHRISTGADFAMISTMGADILDSMALWVFVRKCRNTQPSETAPFSISVCLFVTDSLQVYAV